MYKPNSTTFDPTRPIPPVIAFENRYKKRITGGMGRIPVNLVEKVESPQKRKLNIPHMFITTATTHTTQQKKMNLQVLKSLFLFSARVNFSVSPWECDRLERKKCHTLPPSLLDDIRPNSAHAAGNPLSKPVQKPHFQTGPKTAFPPPWAELWLNLVEKVQSPRKEN